MMLPHGRSLKSFKVHLVSHFLFRAFLCFGSFQLFLPPVRLASTLHCFTARPPVRQLRTKASPSCLGQQGPRLLFLRRYKEMFRRNFHFHSICPCVGFILGNECNPTHLCPFCVIRTTIIPFVARLSISAVAPTEHQRNKRLLQEERFLFGHSTVNL